MAHFYSDLFFYYVMPITKKYQQQSTYSGASTYSNDYTSSGTDSYTFTYSKTEVIWTKGGYRRGPGMKSPPVTMFSITSDLQDYEIDYISVGHNLSSSGMKAPSSGSNSYTVNVQRLISGSMQRVYIYLKYKNAFEIPLTSSGATTCKTAQKYCDKNIIVYPKLQEKTAAPTSASQAITADSGYAGLSKVTISAVPTETKTVTAGTSTTTVAPTSGKFLTSVTVNPTPSEERLAIPKANAQVVTPNSGKLLSSVTVDAVPTEEKTVTAGTNTTTVTPTSGKFFTSVTVNPTPSEEKTVEITSSGNTVITPSSGKLLSKVTVSPMLESYSVAAEATEKVVTPTDGYAGLSSVTIAAAPLQDITVTQATDIAQEITNPDPGYYGFGKITVPQLTGEEKSVTITENGTTTVNYSDPKLMSKVTITTNVPSITDVATAAGMNAVLVEANVGKVYRFTGTTDETYTNGDLYEVITTFTIQSVHYDYADTWGNASIKIKFDSPPESEDDYSLSAYGGAVQEERVTFPLTTTSMYIWADNANAGFVNFNLYVDGGNSEEIIGDFTDHIGYSNAYLYNGTPKYNFLWVASAAEI